MRSIEEAIEGLAQAFCRFLRPTLSDPAKTKPQWYANLKQELNKLREEGFTSSQIIERIKQCREERRFCEPNELFTEAERKNLIIPGECYYHSEFRTKWNPPKVYYDPDLGEMIRENVEEPRITLKKRYSLHDMLNYIYSRLDIRNKDYERDCGALNYLLSIATPDEILFAVDFISENEYDVRAVINISNYLSEGSKLLDITKTRFICMGSQIGGIPWENGL